MPLWFKESIFIYFPFKADRWGLSSQHLNYLLWQLLASKPPQCWSGKKWSLAEMPVRVRGAGTAAGAGAGVPGGSWLGAGGACACALPSQALCSPSSFCRLSAPSAHLLLQWTVITRITTGSSSPGVCCGGNFETGRKTFWGFSVLALSSTLIYSKTRNNHFSCCFPFKGQASNTKSLVQTSH